MRRKVFFVLGLMILPAVLPACAGLRGGRDAQFLPETPYHDEHVLRVGVTPSYPPLVFKRDGKLVGLEVDMAKALAAELGKEAHFIDIPWLRQIDALMDHRTDIIMAGMTITQAREVRIAFTEPYLEIGQQGLVRRQDYDHFSSMKSPFYKEARIGVEEGTTGDYVVQDLFHQATRVPFDTAREGAEALADGKIDLFVHDSPVIWWLASELEADGLVPIRGTYTREYLAWGVRVQERALLTSANAVLERWKADGTLAAFIKRWLPYAGPTALDSSIPEAETP